MPLFFPSYFKRTIAFCLLFFSISLSLRANDIELKLPPAIMEGIQATIRVDGAKQNTTTKPILLIDGVRINLKVDADGYYAQHFFAEPATIQLIGSSRVISKTVNPIPLWLSIFPPLIAIIMALLTKEVFSSFL